MLSAIHSINAIIHSNIVHPSPMITKTFSKFVWNIETDEKTIFLTFDDGPIPDLTDKILNILNEYQAHATFFCVGDNVRKYPELYQKILDRNHAVGNHTFSHLNGWKTDSKHYLDNIKEAEKYISSDLFRPPYGKLKPAQYAVLKKKYKIILWDVLTMDYDKSLTPKLCFGNVEKFAKQGSILVFHDNLKAEKNMIYALTKTLDRFSKLGFTFKKIDSNVVNFQTLPEYNN